MPLGIARSREPTAEVLGWARVIAQRAALGRLRGSDGGASRDRTGDLLVANQTLSQLSYGPSFTG
jgi:hypothetical protein